MEVKTIMHNVVRTLMPDDDLGQASKVLEEEGAMLVPVCTHDGKVVGTLTIVDADEATVQNDAESQLSKEAHAVRSVETMMSRDFISCMGSDDVDSLARRAAEKGQTHALVLDEEGQLRGLADLTPFQNQEDDANSATPRKEEKKLDEALRETFPASDPISPS